MGTPGRFRGKLTARSRAGAGGVGRPHLPRNPLKDWPDCLEKAGEALPTDSAASWPTSQACPPSLPHHARRCTSSQCHSSRKSSWTAEV